MKHLLVEPCSATNLLYLLALIRLDYKLDNLSNPGKVLVGFDELKSHLFLVHFFV